MVDNIVQAFSQFIAPHYEYFRTRGHDNSVVARQYLNGLMLAEKCNYEAMAAVVEDACPQRFQNFISRSPWNHEGSLRLLAMDADQLVGGQPDSCLLIDETSFVKQGNRSVGVARQWCGRLGKVENCQVAVFAVLSNGHYHIPVDTRLYLPKEWVSDKARCEEAGIPSSACKLIFKSNLALAMIRAALARGQRFEWVGVDAGYGKEPLFLRALDDDGVTFVADVHSTQQVWLTDPELHVPTAKPRGRRPKKQRAATTSITVDCVARSLQPSDWTRCTLRDSTRGLLQVDVSCRRVWLWDGEEETARCWHLIIRREVGSPKTIKFSLSNAPANTPTLRLAQMQGHRYWVERVFEDAKGECGLADYQALGWVAWHHHVTMVMLAMLFIAQQRSAHSKEIDLLSPRDVVEILKEILPRKPETTEELVLRINKRHQRRRQSIESRYRSRRQSPIAASGTQ